MTEPTPVTSLSAESVLLFLEKADTELPKIIDFLTTHEVMIESFLQSASANSTLTAIANKFFPGFGAIIGLLTPMAGSIGQIVPVLRFFQTALDTFESLVPKS